MIPPPFISEIQEAVAAEFWLDVCEMKSQRRARAIARPRQVAMFLARTLTLRSLPEIGRMFGGRDHSTVIHAVTTVEMRLRDDGELAQHVRLIGRRLAQLVDERAARG